MATKADRQYELAKELSRIAGERRDSELKFVSIPRSFITSWMARFELAGGTKKPKYAQFKREVRQLNDIPLEMIESLSESLIAEEPWDVAPPSSDQMLEIDLPCGCFSLPSAAHQRN